MKHRDHHLAYRPTLIAAATAAVLWVGPFAERSFAQEAAAETASSECTCTCEACMKMHGPEAKAKLAAEEAQKEAQLLLDRMVEVLEEEPPIAALELVPPAPADDDRGYMGVFLGDGDSGVGIDNVVPGSPAAGADLQAGDVIVAVEEMPVRNVAELQAVLRELRAGDSVTVEIERGDDEITKTFALGKRQVLEAGVPAPAPPALPQVEALEALGYGAAADDEATEEAITALRGLGYLGEVEVEEEPEEIVEEIILLPTEVPQLEAGTEHRVRLVRPDVRKPIVVELKRDGFVGEGFEVRDHNETDVDSPRRERIVRLHDVTKKDPNVTYKVRGAESGTGRFIFKADGAKGTDALPDGYIEITTTRERRPSSDSSSPELRERIHRLEREVAELEALVSEMRAELKRRNPK